jgi:hypothetical protein
MEQITRRTLFFQACVGMILFILPLNTLISHTSQVETVLGRYSSSYFLLMVLYFLVLMVMGLMTWRLSRLDGVKISYVNKAFNLLRKSKILYGFVVIGPWLAIFIKLDLVEGEIGQATLVQISLLGILLLWSSTIITVGETLPKIRESLGKMLLVLLSLVITLVGLEIILRSNPAMIPNAARPHLAGGGLFLRKDLIFDNPPISVGFRYRPNQDYWTNYSDTNRDLYSLSQGSLQQIGSTEDSVLARIHFITDENGYPNSSPLHDQYDIVTTGDSFSGAGWVSTPWPRMLEELSKKTVLNLSIPMYGPQSEVEAVRKFGFPRRPKWVIVGYFEGNDLTDALAYDEIQKSGYGWEEYSLKHGGLVSTLVSIQTLRFGFSDILGKLYVHINPQLADVEQRPSDKHIIFIVGNKKIPLAFNTNYLSILTSSHEDIQASANYKLTIQTFLKLKQEFQEEGAQLIIIFIPSKEHIYLPLINDDALIKNLLSDIPAYALNKDGSLYENVRMEATMQLVRKHNNDQRDVISEFAKANKISFLDLTEVFQNKAKEGDDLYYEMDTHWNQNGQNLAAETIYKFMFVIP